MRRLRLLLAVAALVCVRSHAQEVQSSAVPQTLIGKCINVIDGDTIDVVVTTPGSRPTTATYRVRLAYIDAPERSQEYGSKALAHLKAQALQETVRVEYRQRDRYDRIIGEVTVARATDHASVKQYDRATLNDHMIASGWAWQYRQYDKDSRRSDLEDAARKKRIGLWAGKSPMPPWEFRKSKAKIGRMT